MPSFGWDVNPSVPCRCLRHLNDLTITVKVAILG
jgi:hypothetical protein